MNNDETDMSDSESEEAPEWVEPLSSESKKEDREWNDLDKARLKGDVRWWKVYGWVVPSFTVPVFHHLFLPQLLPGVGTILLPLNWLG